MLQVSFKTDEQFNPCSHQNRSNFQQKSIKKWHRFQWCFSFLIFYRFQLDFRRILAPKWAGFCCGKWCRECCRGQTGLQRPSGLHLGPLWKRFGSIFEWFLIKFGQNFWPKFPSKVCMYQSIALTSFYLHRSPLFVPTHFFLELCWKKM